jgi:hypothetical protein
VQDRDDILRWPVVQPPDDSEGSRRGKAVVCAANPTNVASRVTKRYDFTRLVSLSRHGLYMRLLVKGIQYVRRPEIKLILS